MLVFTLILDSQKYCVHQFFLYDTFLEKRTLSNCQLEPKFYINDLQTSESGVLWLFPGARSTFQCYKVGPVSLLQENTELRSIKAVPFLFFEQNAAQLIILFLFRIVNKIEQTGSVVKKPAVRATHEDKAVSDRFRLCLKILAYSDGHK